MTDAPVQLAAESVFALTEAAARRYRRFARMAFLVAVFFTWGFIGFHAKHGLPHGLAPAVLAALVSIVLPGLVGVRLLRRARHAAQIGARARSDSTLTWHLVGGFVGASDERSPRPDLAFAVSRSMQRLVTALPPAKAS